MANTCSSLAEEKQEDTGGYTRKSADRTIHRHRAGITLVHCYRSVYNFITYTALEFHQKSKTTKTPFATSDFSKLRCVFQDDCLVNFQSRRKSQLFSHVKRPSYSMPVCLTHFLFQEKLKKLTKLLTDPLVARRISYYQIT